MIKIIFSQLSKQATFKAALVAVLFAWMSPLDASAQCPTVTISPSNPPPICPAGTVVLTAVNGSGGYQWETIGGVIDGPSTSSTLTVTNGGQYRVTANRSCGGRQSSDYVTVTIATFLSPGSISGSQTICSGSVPGTISSVYDASGSNGSYNYQWQSRPPAGSWSDIGGGTGVSYSPGSVSAATEYRRRVQTSCGDTEYTNTVTVSVYSATSAGSISSSQTICTGTQPSTLTGTAAGGGNGSYSYQWEVSSDNVNWSNVSGATSQNYSPGTLSSTTYYRRTVTSCGQSATTSSVSIAMYPTLNPGAISGPSSVCVNTAPGNLSNGVTASGADGLLTYQWQFSNDNSSWSNLGSSNSTSYNATGTLSATRYFRRMVTANCGSVGYSNVLTVTVTAPGSVTITPSSPAPACPQTGILLTAVGGTGGYTWHSNTTLDGNINLSTYTADETGSYWVTANVTCGTDDSDPVSITIMAPLQPGSIGGPANVCTGAAPSLTSTTLPSGSAGGYTYQWEYRSPAGSGSWLNVPTGGTSATCTPPAITASTEYRRKAMTSCGDFSHTSPVTVGIFGAVTPGTISSNQTICSSNAPATLTATAPSGGSGSFTYLWQSSTDNVNWTSASGTNTNATYSPPTLVNNTGTNTLVYYRRQATSCTTSNSNTVTITVQPTTVGGTASSGDGYGTATGSLTLTGYVGTVLKWQAWNGTIWIDIAASGSPTLSYTGVTVTTSYRAVVQSGNCTTVNSSTGVLTIYPAHLITVPGGGCAAIYPGGPSAQLTTTAGLFSYQWSKDGVDIPGATTKDLTVTVDGIYRVRVKQTATSSTYTSPPYRVGTVFDNNCNDWNYIQTIDFKVEGVAAASEIYTRPSKDYAFNTAYFDGLSRGMQSVTMGGSPTDKDMIQPVAYDAFSREANKFLPYTSTDRTGNYRVFGVVEQGAFYTSATDVVNDTRPYSLTTFEASPLNRPLLNYGIGQNWTTDNKKSENQYTINYTAGTAQENIIIWNINNPGFPVRPASPASAFYGKGELSVKVSIDEDGKIVREYTNKSGQVILKKVHIQGSTTDLLNVDNWASTYYVYNKIGLLACVLQPELSKALAAGTTDPSLTQINDLAFRYRYDRRNRMISKHVPGGDSVLMVYDKRNRLVLTQDGNQRTTNKWGFTKYDYLNRPILTGIYTHGSAVSQAFMTGIVESVLHLYESGGGTIHGYTNVTYPTDIAANDVLTVSYYDDYSVSNSWGASYEYTADVLNYNGFSMPASVHVRPIGLVTATLVKVLDGGTTYLKTVNYYDDRMRPVQVVADNHVGSVDRSSSLMDFAGQVLKAGRYHKKGAVTRTVVVRKAYDHSGRLLRTWHRIDNQPEVTLSAQSYNSIGQVKQKKLYLNPAGSVDVDPIADGSSVAAGVNVTRNVYNNETAVVASGSIILQPGYTVPYGKTYLARIGRTHNIADAYNDGLGAKYLQEIDYRYNIRGWLTSINQADVSMKYDGNASIDYFGMEVGYEAAVSGLTTTKAYNGNISATKWATHGNKRQSYVYAYDGANRLLQANHFDLDSAGAWAKHYGEFAERGLSYDLNGNILTLKRNRSRTNPYTYMDNLSYAYTGNQLTSVTDAGVLTKGFLDGYQGVDDFAYDKNGNMRFDRNKGITPEVADIQYNHLNLPTSVTRGGPEIKYIYDATGRKLAQTIMSSSTVTKRTDYVGEFVYENDALQYIGHEEGRVTTESQNLIYANDFKTDTGITKVGTTTSAYTANGEQYIQVTSSGSTTQSGVYPIGGTIPVLANERYLVRVKGFRDTNCGPVYIMLRLSNVTTDFPKALLPKLGGTEAWIEQVITVGASGNLDVGLAWNTVASGEKFYLNDVQVIKLASLPTPEYQYDIKDYLGNVRLTFTSKPQPTDTYTADFETLTNVAFNNYTRVGFDLMDNTDPGTTYQYSQKLDGLGNNRVGLAKSIAVQRGDSISIEAYVHYWNLTSTSNPNALISSLAAAFGVSAGAPGEAGTIYNSLNTYAGTVVGGDHPGDNDVVPKAFVNILFFDKNYVFLEGAWKQVTSAAEQTSLSVKQPHEFVNKKVVVPDDGFAFIFVSNEHDKAVDVYFDDVKVRHVKSAVLQSQDYYPFGLTFNEYRRENSVLNPLLYNNKELQDELSLGWLDYGARMYMPEIGRWGVHDPLAETNRRWSPYKYANDNPLRFIDPDGMSEVDANGTVTLTDPTEIKNFLLGFRKMYGDKSSKKSSSGDTQSNHTGNLVIHLREFATEKYSSTKWNAVQARGLAEIETAVSEYSEAGALENLVIVAHGDPAGISLGPDNLTRGDFQTQNSDAQAFNRIVQKVTKNGNVVLMVCRCAMDMAGVMRGFIRPDINIYMNNDYTSLTVLKNKQTGSEREYVKFGTMLTDPENVNRGWVNLSTPKISYYNVILEPNGVVRPIPWESDSKNK